MKHRLVLARPNDFSSFKIYNGTLSKSFTRWEFSPDYEAICLFSDLEGAKICRHLDDVLRLVGSHATLWIGNWQGTVAPMDVPPEGWTYPNDEPLEPEWLWQWHPVPFAERELVNGLNADIAVAWQSKSPLKALVPFQFQRQTGETAAVEAIPIGRLPDLMKKEAPWTFEWETKS